MKENLIKGIKEFQQKNYAAALNFLENTGPEDLLESNYYMAICYIRLEQYAKALECLELLLITEGNIVRLVQIKILKAFVLEKMERLDEALSWLEILINEGIEAAQIYGMYGTLLNQKNKKKEAVVFLNKALNMEPDNPNLQNSLAYVFAELGVFLDRALKLVRQALTKDPENYLYLDTLGWVYHKMNNDALAQVFLKKAWNKNPHPIIDDHLKIVEKSMAVRGEKK